jgi:hypothetical protein
MDTTRREPLLTVSFFEEQIRFANETIAEFTALLNDASIVSPEILLFSLFSYRYSLLFLKYSRGYPIEEMRPDLLALVDALETYKAHPLAEDFFFNGEQDEYMQALTLVSLALLHVETAVFARLVAAIGANGQDYILEWLIGRRLPQRPATTRLLFPKTYARLRDAIQAPRDIQSTVLQQFLAAWYESLNTVWYNIHAHRQDSAGFTGYWCWEAAAVAYGLSADDAALRPMPYYPTDLADYAFGRRPPQG